MEAKKIDKDILRRVYRPRSKTSHKGDFGRLLVIGGSRVFSGAPALAALAALRAGVDIAYVISPQRAANIIASFSPNLIAEPVEGERFEKHHVNFVIEKAKNFDAFCVGSGLGIAEATKAFVNEVVERIEKPMVIDADGIKLLETSKLRKNIVLTPHAGELSIIWDKAAPSNVGERLEFVKEVASSFGCVVLLKGHADIISDGKRTAVNETGNPYMTVGGTGDVLAGVCSALLAMDTNPFEAACASAYIVGCAGDIAAKEKGPSMVATDVIDKISEVIRMV